MKTSTKSEVEVAMFAPQAILNEIQEWNQLKEEVIMLLEEDINLPERCMEKYRYGSLNDSFCRNWSEQWNFFYFSMEETIYPSSWLKRLAWYI